MRQFLSRNAVLLCFGILVSSSAWACRCQQLPLADYYSNAGVVLIATVLSVKHSPDSGAPIRIEIETGEQFKGESLTQVQTASSSASCGMNLAIGDEVWVFGRRINADGLYEISTCNGSRTPSDFIDVPAAEVTSALRQLAAEQI